MSLLDIKPVEKKSSSGGGLFGSVLGALVGAAAAPFTGGASLAGVAAGAGLGSTLGGLGGSIIDPAKNPALSSQIPHSDVSPLKNMESHPEMMMLRLQDAKEALKSSNLPVPQYEQYMNHISTAQDALRKRLGVA